MTEEINNVLETYAAQGMDFEVEQWETIDELLEENGLDPEALTDEGKFQKFLVILAKEKVEDLDETELMELLGF